MAAPYNPPVKGEEFICYVTLTDASDPRRFKSNPTIAAGDWKISKDGGAFANLTNLPTVSPASGVGVKIELTTTEMNADNALIVGRDQSDPPEWSDFSLNIVTTT